MSAVGILAMVRDYGASVELADLGDWGRDELRSEYDPDGAVIRVNRRALARIAVEQRSEFVALCVAHEIYHLREHRGEVVRLRGRAKREAAAESFARSMLAAP